MSDEEVTPSSLHKRHRNLMVFSVAVLIIGWAPNEMQSSFSFLTIKFEKIEPSYLWSWALAINAYLFLAWVYTSRVEDSWLYWRSGKIQTFFRYKDYFWLRLLVPRKHVRVGLRPEVFGLKKDSRNFIKYLQPHDMVTNNRRLWDQLRTSEKQEFFISKSQFMNDLRYASKGSGYHVTVYSGRHHRKPIYLMMEKRSNPSPGPKQQVRQAFAELFFTLLPALAVGILGVGTAAANLFTAT